MTFNPNLSMKFQKNEEIIVNLTPNNVFLDLFISRVDFILNIEK